MTTAQTYDALLARRDFEKLADLLADEVIYLSPGVGHYRGKLAVMRMLRDFFAKHPAAAWENARWRLEQGEILHDYRLTVPTALPEQRNRRGTERMSFNAEGLISRIQVTG